MAFGLFITRNDIIKNTPLGGAIDADALLPFVRTAQEKYILNLLGTVLYNKLQDDMLSKALDNAGYYSTRLQDYLLANSSNIPEYLQSTGDSTQIYPDQSNQYFGGINL